MSADLIGDDACREAFNKARQQRFSVHGLDVVCEPDIFRAGYAAGRDSEIAKRDARMAELEKELQAGATAVENCELFRAELAAIKAQEPAFMWHKGATEDESEVVDVDCACPCCVPLYAVPVSEAKAQVVVMPPCPYMPGSQPTDFTDYELGEIHGRIAMWEEVKRLNAAPAAPAADAWIPVSERLPDSGSTVIAYYLNSYGKGRTIRAQHVEAWTIEAEDVADVDTDCVEYSEQDDCYYLLQGWYECIDNWDEYYRVAVTEGPITHWMPLPAAPIKIEANRHD